MIRAVHQLVAGFSKGDAISNESRYFRDLFRGWGLKSEIYCETHRVLPEFRREVNEVTAYRPDAETLTFLHLSMGSVANDIFARTPGPKALLYHNVTPAEFFAAVQPQTAQFLAWGRKQMQQLAGVADLNMADSRFNAAELEAAGYRDVSVMPLVLDFTHLDGRPDPALLREYRDGRANILFVGRFAPNKCIDDLVLLFAHYHRHINRDARLLHVGSYAGTETYAGLVRSLARKQGVGSDCIFYGSARQDQLRAFYRAADLFLCTSEHEGFCIPLLEAMHFDVPILAFDAGAVGETLGGSGVLYREKDLHHVAEMMHRMLTDESLRHALIEKQRARLRRYREQNLEKRLKEQLQPLLG